MTEKTPTLNQTAQTGSVNSESCELFEVYRFKENHKILKVTAILEMSSTVVN